MAAAATLRESSSHALAASVGVACALHATDSISHVTVREMGLEIWGGGGVPADDGPPLGLSWNRAAPDQHAF